MVEVMQEEVGENNARSLVEFVKRHYSKIDFQEDIINEVFRRGGDLFVRNPSNGEPELLNERNFVRKKTWTSNLLYNDENFGLYQVIAEVTGNPVYGRRMGKEFMVYHPELSPLGNLVGAILGVQGIVARVPKSNEQWNTTKKMIIYDNSPGHFLIGVQHKPKKKVHDIAMKYHPGLFDGAAEVAGQIGFETILRDGLKIPFIKGPESEGIYFECEGEYKVKSLPRRVFYQLAVRNLPEYGRNLDIARENALRHNEEQEMKEIANQSFQKFVSKALVERITKGIRPRLGVHKRDLTVMFSDIRNFTTISETLGEDALVRMLAGYFSEIVPEIENHNGYVQTYIGDAIMPIFEHAHDAVKSAVAMRFALRRFNDSLAENPEYFNGLRFLRTGIGIATGEMRYGITGTENRMQETVLGDSVNVGSRLEGLTKSYRVPIIMDENTCDDLGTSGMLVDFSKGNVLDQIINEGKILARELDIVRPKGKNKELTIYEVIPQSYNKEVVERRIMLNDLYMDALQLSRGRRKDLKLIDALREARDIFKKISSAYPTGLGRKVEWVDEDQGGDYVCEQKIRELDELILKAEKDPSFFKNSEWYVKVFNGK